MLRNLWRDHIVTSQNIIVLPLIVASIHKTSISVVYPRCLMLGAMGFIHLYPLSPLSPWFFPWWLGNTGNIMDENGKFWINLAYFGIIYSTFDPSRMTSLSPGGAAPAVPPRCWASQVASSVAGGPRGPASHGGTLWSSQGWLSVYRKWITRLP